MISLGQEGPFLKVCAQISLQFLPIVRTIPEIESGRLRSFFIDDNWSCRSLGAKLPNLNSVDDFFSLDPEDIKVNE